MKGHKERKISFSEELLGQRTQIDMPLSISEKRRQMCSEPRNLNGFRLSAGMP